jgi:hypothetical protein
MYTNAGSAPASGGRTGLARKTTSVTLQREPKFTWTSTSVRIKVVLQHATAIRRSNCSGIPEPTIACIKLVSMINSRSLWLKQIRKNVVAIALCLNFRKFVIAMAEIIP